ncbi:hypothetical protein B5F40_15395 [Gordonibacter sp. An230]|nr:hypothetical protein B5F40_15395 [Gordonibacter sp. An230]
MSEQLDEDEDGFLSDDERLGVTTIDVRNMGIASLEGIEKFSNLQKLQCSYNSLASLGLSGLPSLRTLRCNHNSLASLDVSGLSALEYLQCSNNSLASLDASGLPSLRTLYCSGNSLASLGLSGLSALETLYCDSNSLASLDASGLPSLRTLRCSYNSLASLDVGDCENLEELRFNDNDLKVLDLRQNKKLKVAYHAVEGERVYISAGMTDYIGCDVVSSHTGNITIDLDGLCDPQPDGSRTVDLHEVISQTLIDQITENSALYDPETGILTIPAGREGVDIAASDGNRYYFGEDLGDVPGPVAHAVTFVSQGETVATASVEDGGAVARPEDPRREGFAFLGWFSDEACTAAYDFASPVTGDLVLYAGWEPLPAPEPVARTVTFVSQGETVATASVEDGGAVARPEDPRREGFAFLGWFSDEACTAAYDFASPVTGDLVLYAGWEPLPAPEPVPAPDPSEPALAKTGDGVPFAAVAAAASLGLAALVVAVRKKAR